MVEIEIAKNSKKAAEFSDRRRQKRKSSPLNSARPRLDFIKIKKGQMSQNVCNLYCPTVTKRQILVCDWMTK